MNSFQVPGLRKLRLWWEQLLFSWTAGRRLAHPVQIFGWPLVRCVPGSEWQVGKGVVMISDPYFSEPGLQQACSIRLLAPTAKLYIGDHTGLNGTAIAVAQEVRIGKEVLLGANTVITDTDFHPLLPENRRYSRSHVGTAPVRIDDGAFIGMHCIVLKGVHIGQGAVLGAGSVVTRSIPPYEIWAGNPAHFIKKCPKKTST